MKLKPIEQQVVAVVGASSGIGRETALQFAKRRAKLVVSARSEPGLASLVNEISQLGGEAIAIPADVTVFEQVQKIADRAAEHYGCLDTWVHSAATAIIAPFEQVTPEEFKRVIDVNLMGQVYGAMAALPHLRRERRGALIHNKGLTMKTGRTHVHKYLHTLLDRVQKGEIDPSFVITHSLPLEQAPHGYEIFKDKKDNCIKIVLKPGLTA
jgi:NAD(P)-dependent dehydrogenase (short-subunit alcohol dehydrogenase family)